jgi:Transcription factor WhiB
MSAPWIELTAAIVRGTPRLPNALCRGRPELFDADDDETAAHAADVCHRCPDRLPCAAWADTLRHNQINGVLAGPAPAVGQPPLRTQTTPIERNHIMTTSTHNDIIAQARRRYLAANPLRLNSIPTMDGNTGKPTGESWTFPNIGDIQILGCKLGMEYLAICHDDDAVEDWINVCLGIVKDPEMAGILFANVFRGINVLIGKFIEQGNARDQMQRMAVDARRRDFSQPFSDHTEEPDAFDPEGDEPW